jgi:L-fucose mutarotase/ribose pyranase (RbsD/FucU family)
MIARRDELRRGRARAILDGVPFDSSALRGLDEAIAAMGDADDEVQRRQRAAVHDAAAKRHRRVAAVVASLDGTRLAALARMEAALRTAVAEAAEVRRLSSEMNFALRELGPAVATTLLAASVDKRLATLIVGELRAIRSDQYGIGDTIEWHSPNIVPVEGYAEAERAATAHDIVATLERTKP